MPAPAHSQVGAHRVERLRARDRRGQGRHESAGGPRYSAYRSRRSASSVAIGALLVAVLLTGWLNSDEGHLTPEGGIGYALGILGASAMLLLLIYPLRKRLRVLRALGSMSGWFRLHMTLGLVGPALILFHSNFKLGSLNSNVALFSMLTVAASGLIGRYLYRQVHLGLYGRKAEIREILADIERLKDAVEGGLPLSKDLHAKLDAHASAALAERGSVLAWLLALIALRLRSLRRRARLTADVAQALASERKQRGWTRRVTRRRAAEIGDLLALYFAAVNKAAAFAFYERLFALWHVLHLPLFILLILTALVHVIAVHLY